MAYVFDQRYKSWVDPDESARIPEADGDARKAPEAASTGPTPDPAPEPVSMAKAPELLIPASLLPDHALQGIILAEILGPPVSRRQGRIRRR
jgi:hypothetical protein